MRLKELFINLIAMRWQELNWPKLASLYIIYKRPCYFFCQGWTNFSLPFYDLMITILYFIIIYYILSIVSLTKHLM